MRTKLLLIGLITNIIVFAQTQSDNIIVDQFGYLNNSQKVAILKNAKIGFDVGTTFTPGNNYAVVRTSDQQEVFTGSPTQWNSGQTDTASGDQVWRFDFSSVTSNGTYYILDKDNNFKSYDFEIGDNVYHEVLKHAFRVFFYQRSGFAKNTPYADAAWADGASHIGALQDKNCRKYDDANNAATEKDVHGGWYDAGDFNKYTPWTANYVIELLMAYEEKPDAWGDDFNIPESGNGTPDILDEVKWGMDHLLRLQNTDGSVIAIVDAAHASPPSAGTEKSLYGDVNTISTSKFAAAAAKAAKIYGDLGDNTYKTTLQAAAIKAYDWSIANPRVLWKNNDAGYGSSGIGAGQQESDDDYPRTMAQIEAAMYLFKLTGDTKYRDYFDNNYGNNHMIQWTYAYPFETTQQEVLLQYTSIPNATASVVSAIKSKFSSAMNGAENFQATDGDVDGYMAYIKAYVWGSNRQVANQGVTYNDYVVYVNGAKNAAAQKYMEQYLHYLHGVNPLNLVYLSNMYSYGGDNCVNEFYHTWFADGSAKWDRVGTSTYGPAPGFVVGGSNPKYKVDQCCPSGCGNDDNNKKCTSESWLPTGQPVTKSYKDFNTSWPLNSWEVTENSNGYQTAYLRLLSKFVKSSSATSTPKAIEETLSVYPNPSSNNFTINSSKTIAQWQVFDTTGKIVLEGNGNTINAQRLAKGTYILKTGNKTVKITKK